MNSRSTIPRQRLRNQLLLAPRTDPADVVSHFGAIQAQDYLGALWAVGLRTRDATERDVEDAIAERRIVRCWPMRGTLHFVAAGDVRWMLELLAPRVLTRNRTRLEREFAIDDRTLRKARRVVARALAGRSATRPEIYAALEKAGIATGASRGLHIIFALAHERLICFGPRRGKQPTFVLLDEWIPPATPLAREEALGRLAHRYLAAHAPATAADLAWWSGLTLREAKEAFALTGADDERATAFGRAKRRSLLLPPFDEYTVGYRDRAAVLSPEFGKRVNAGGGMLSAIIVIDGVVAGTWKRRLTGSSVAIALSPFRPLTGAERAMVDAEADRYGRFLGVASATVA